MALEPKNGEKFLKSEQYKCKLKRIAEIERFASRMVDYRNDSRTFAYQIWHSNGGGGGLEIKNRCQEFFGKEVTVRFQRTAGGIRKSRPIFELIVPFHMIRNQLVYDEWLEPLLCYELPEDLLDI
jgi:hypothetical protein